MVLQMDPMVTSVAICGPPSTHSPIDLELFLWFSTKFVHTSLCFQRFVFVVSLLCFQQLHTTLLSAVCHVVFAPKGLWVAPCH